VNIALMHKTAPVGGVVHAPARDTTYVGSKPGGLWKRTGDKKRRILPAVMRPHIQDLRQKEKVTCVVSRSHLSKETMEIVKQFGDVTLVPMGSSLKFMALIEQQADIYPRIGVTMEWDIAAAHAILHAANRGIYQTDFLTELAYNKRDLRNPYFIAF